MQLSVKGALIVLLCLFILASVLPGCVITVKNNGTTNKSAPTRYQVAIANVTVYAEAANTPVQQEEGLMHRTSLDANAGMLFVFPREERESFWMKNMLIPLDIIFITADSRVLQIYSSVPPCAGDPCTLYPSSAPIKYALEVNAGFSDRNGVKAGDEVRIVPLN